MVVQAARGVRKAERGDRGGEDQRHGGHGAEGEPLAQGYAEGRGGTHHGERKAEAFALLREEAAGAGEDGDGDEDVGGARNGAHEHLAPSGGCAVAAHERGKEGVREGRGHEQKSEHMRAHERAPGEYEGGLHWIPRRSTK